MENPGYQPDSKEVAIIPNRTTKNEELPIMVYPRRWVILAIFSLSSMMNEVIWISLSSISTIVKEYYNVSFSAVNWLAMIFSALYFTVAGAVYVLNRYGLRFTIIIGALLNAVSSGLRLVGYTRTGYPFALVGNIIGGIAQSFLMFIPPTLSSVWFGEKERGRASAIGMLMNMLGVAIGFLMSSMIIPHSTDYDGAVRHGMLVTLVIQTVICSALLIASFILIKKAPACPPSVSQAMNINRKRMKSESKEKIIEKGEEVTETNTESTGFFKNVKKMMSSLTFHLMVQTYAIYYGIFNSMSTLLNELVTRYYPLHVTETGLMGFTATLIGLIAMLLAGVWIDKTHRYKFIALLIFSGAFVTSLSFTLVMKYSGNFTLAFVCYAIYGFFQYPFLAIGLEFLSELMYPVKESNLSFICLFVGTTYGVIFVNALGAVIHRVGAEYAVYITSGGYLVCFLCVAVVKEDLKRYNVDQNREKQVP